MHLNLTWIDIAGPWERMISAQWINFLILPVPISSLNVSNLESSSKSDCWSRKIVDTLHPNSFFWQIISVDNSKKKICRTSIFHLNKCISFSFYLCATNVCNPFPMNIKSMYSLWMQSSWSSETKSSWLI